MGGRSVLIRPCLQVEGPCRPIAQRTPSRRVQVLTERQGGSHEPDRVWEAIPIVERIPGVLEVQTYGGILRVFVDDAARRAAVVREVLVRAGIVVRSLRQVRPRMEEAFISLMSKQLER